MSQHETPPSAIVPIEDLTAALNYIKHVGANHVMRGQPHPQQWIVDKLESALSVASQSAPMNDSALYGLAARCRPAVKLNATKAAQAVLKVTRGELPAHYKSTLMEDSQRADKLLDDIDAILNNGESIPSAIREKDNG